ncbi:hypothetical protein [Ilumatobacter nonamiensis]|uniref:hypothetical protein n=1 Tax=Ilumatobacter nonamiensis TaxID=467093 RepID=UPI00034C3DFD|nr:hypothetical protein [Ilumatobacter nonamiensis]
MKNTLSTKLLATAAVGALAFGGAACSSDDQDDVDDVVDNVEEDVGDVVDEVEEDVDNVQEDG